MRTKEGTISTPVVSGGRTVAEAGRAANRSAARATFADYRSRKAHSTLLRQDRELAAFARYLVEATGGMGPTGEALAHAPEAWSGITWGLVAGYARWLVLQEYAVGSVNLYLSTVRTYARLAGQAGAIDAHELALIRTVRGYGHTEGKRIDQQREAAGIGTRRGYKKAAAVRVSAAQVQALRDRPDNPQGRRDRLLLCLLLDHGLRVGEVAGLTVSNFDLSAGELSFYRAKVDKTQKHRLTDATRAAAQAYFTDDAPAVGSLLRGSRKGGALTSDGMSARAISAYVRRLGESIGVEGLSPHDLRHAWATRAARNGTPIDCLQEAGGWGSPAMPLRYVAASEIANEGVKLD